MIDYRENMLRSARFEQPGFIPISFSISSGCWERYPPEALQELMAAHRLLFPHFKPRATVVPKYAPWRRADRSYTDSWGCVWKTAENGVTGAVVKHALGDWSSFAGFTPPSPQEHDGWGPIDWADIKSRMAEARAKGMLRSGSLRHGHTFLTLTYLRGYENVIFDMVDDHPHLGDLIGLIEWKNIASIFRRA